MQPLHVFLISVAVVLAAKTVAWLVQLRTRNAGLVDPIWAWTLGLLAVIYALAGSAPGDVRLLLGLMGGSWGVRLGLHLWQRNYGKPEDWRYAQFRARWGAKDAVSDGAVVRQEQGAGGPAASRTRCFANTVSAADINMFWFFQFQNVFTLMLSASAFLPAAFRPGDASLLALWAAGLIWAGAVLGETIADKQMEHFRSNPMNKGRVCRDGLWRYSRHPNYFFECLHWLAYVPLALDAPYGWASFGAPLVMGFLLMKLSGVPMLEAEMVKRKPDYADYIRTTNALIPWIPRKTGDRSQGTGAG